jgi:hypothetical protein
MYLPNELNLPSCPRLRELRGPVVIALERLPNMVIAARAFVRPRLTPQAVASSSRIAPIGTAPAPSPVRIRRILLARFGLGATV